MIRAAALITVFYFSAFSNAHALEEPLQDGLLAEGVMEGELAAMDAHAGEQASKGGLPQFDPEWFAAQTFWLFAFFGLLYVIFAKKTLPDISHVIENRKNHIQSDLETAEALTAEADEVQDAYQAGLTSAQNDAALAIKEVEAKSKEKTDAALDELRTRSDAALTEAEVNIQTSKNNAMDEINKIAVETVSRSVEKIIHVAPDQAKVKTVVENMNQPVKAKAA